MMTTDIINDYTPLIIPTIGVSGYYKLKEPFNSVIIENERYTCKAIRKISDYFANNEDPKVLVYDIYGLPEAEYLDDVAKDSYIIALQSATGHWLYVPVKYMSSYPITNGVPYRSVILSLALPSIPLDTDLDAVLSAMQTIVKDELGVDTVPKIVETSRVVLVPSDKHKLTSANRKDKTDKGKKYKKLQVAHNEALSKITALENYILSKATVLNIRPN